MKNKERTYAEMRAEKVGNMNRTDWLRVKNMCSKCNFYINNQCSKKRIIRKCAEQGLKNKE